MDIGRFGHEDMPALGRLQPPDWNPVYPHFAYYLENDNCTALKISYGDEILGVGAVIRHNDSAWLAHIIIDIDYRGKGLGKLMTSALIESVDRMKYDTIYLMATPEGFHVYKRLGFEAESMQSFYKWDDEQYLPPLEFDSSIRLCTPHDIPKILELDKQVSAEDRAYRIRDGIRNAYVIERQGEVTAYYLPDLLEGPVIASNPADGLEMLKFRLNSKSQVIVPDDNILVNEFIKDIGMKFYRNATRMRLGKPRNYNPEAVFNRFSGQIG